MSTLKRADVKRLEEINAMTNWRLTHSIMAHFNEKGKADAFANAPTEQEKRAQMDLAPHIIFGTDKQTAIASAKNTDIFLTVARRVGNDDELAALLPAKVRPEDVALLTKAGCPSFAALVKRRLEAN